MAEQRTLSAIDSPGLSGWSLLKMVRVEVLTCRCRQNSMYVSNLGSEVIAPVTGHAQVQGEQAG
jgi:hypothetical protein